MKSIGKYNYHRGVEWNWLTQFFVQAELKYGEPDVALRKYLSAQIEATLGRGGIGGISELFDLAGTRGPEYQAWSMSGFLEALHAFAGVSVDVPRRRIFVEPQRPTSWPRISVRKWYGQTPLDMTFAGDDRTRTLEINFPWGSAPEAEIEVSLVVPRRRAVEGLDVRLDDMPFLPVIRQEAIPGTDQTRVCFTVPAGVSLHAALRLRRARVRKSA
jgi:hypothetical protein